MQRLRVVSAAVAVAAALAVAGLGEATAAGWVKVYETDWTNGPGGWSTGQSYLPGKQSPRPWSSNHPLALKLAPVGVYFDGQCGWAIRTGGIPSKPMKIVTRMYMEGSQRNALSVNVRNRGGGLIFKYGMGGSNCVIANCQGSADQPVNLGLYYRLRHPYDLISYFDGGGYYVEMKDLLTGQVQKSGRRNNLKGSGPPACIDIDQEGGRGPALLGRVEVWLWQ
jgi:hypothetical protein